MSSSQHPVALSLERQVGGATKLLATVMCLPLVDGIFPALVLSGALDSALGIVEVGLLIFGGSATVAVILAEMDGDRRDHVKAVLAVGAVLVTVAVVEAALAPTIDSLLKPVFERFAGLVILAVAAKTASARIGEYLPSPGVIVGLGLLASLDLSGASLTLAADPGLMLRAGAAAAVGVGFALLVALLGPTLRTTVDIDRFRFGSAVALGVLPLSIFGLVPEDAPIALAVLGIAALLAFDPGTDGEDAATAVADGGAEDADAADAADDAPDEESGDDPENPAVQDAEHLEDAGGSSADRVSNYLTTENEREPWL